MYLSDLGGQPGVVDRHRRLACQRAQQILAAGRKGHDGPIFLPGVDQLQDTKHLFLVIQHGHGEHALSPIIILEIKIRTESVWGRIVDGVSVGDVQVALGGGHIARDALFTDGHGELVEKILLTLLPQSLVQGFILGYGEAQYPPFPQIEAACIGVGEGSGLPNDHLQKLVEIMHAGQSDTHLG